MLATAIHAPLTPACLPACLITLPVFALLWLQRPVAASWRACWWPLATAAYPP